jgi:hypothetical protein
MTEPVVSPTKAPEPAWWTESLYGPEIAALGPAGKRLLLEVERGCSNLQDLLLVALPTARMADRMERINERLATDPLMPGGKPNRLLAELVRVEKQYLMNLRSLGICDKDAKKSSRELGLGY